MNDRKPPEPTDDFDARLSRARQSEQKRYGKTGDLSNQQQSGIGQAMRMGVEMVSAIAVGTAIGWLLDNWLDTSPWLKIVFILLGAVAGMLNVYRLASGYGYAAGYQKSDQEEDKGKN